MARVTQRDVMRDIYRRLGGDQDAVVAAYAAAERRGDVVRSSNVHGITPEEYARRLYADGVAKGWLACEPTVDKWDDMEVRLTRMPDGRRVSGQATPADLSAV